MAENSTGSPLFADRYRFQIVGNDWDRGRSGFTSLIYDEKEDRQGVIKRAETISKRLVDGLQNEEKALRHLKGLGIPDIYDSGQVIYNSKNYYYIVIEYIEGVRVEKNISSLSLIERADIITQFFGILSRAHQKGIVNGDVDLKHLFWRNNKDKKQLVIIDWGNSKIDIDSRKQAEFSYDLARSAEIIFALVTYSGHPPATGSIALPDPSGIIDGLRSLPKEFRALCEWAPRTPTNGVSAPYTAKELYEISRKWLATIQNQKASTQHPLQGKNRILGIGIVAIVFIAALLWGGAKFINFPTVSTTASTTPARIISETPPETVTNTPTIPPLTETSLPTITPTESDTPIPAITVSAYSYSPLITFDQSLKPKRECWENDAISPSQLLPIPQDGFYQRTDKNWAFNVGFDHSVKEAIQVDFTRCIDVQKMSAFAFNVFVKRLDQYALEPSREFGIFLQNQSGQRREYTLWQDKNDMFLRIREDNKEPKDYPIKDIINPANIKPVIENSVRTYRSFRIMLFLELNNQGSDMIYLLEGPLDENLNVKDIDPSRMFRINDAILPAFGNIQKIGLLGYGGKTETIVWPLTLLERNK